MAQKLPKIAEMAQKLAPAKKNSRDISPVSPSFSISVHVSLQIPSYYDTEYGNDYDDLDFFLDDDFARRSLIGGECSTGCFN